MDYQYSALGHDRKIYASSGRVVCRIRFTGHCESPTGRGPHIEYWMDRRGSRLELMASTAGDNPIRCCNLVTYLIFENGLKQLADLTLEDNTYRQVSRNTEAKRTKDGGVTFRPLSENDICITLSPAEFLEFRDSVNEHISNDDAA